MNKIKLIPEMKVNEECKSYETSSEIENIFMTRAENLVRFASCNRNILP